MELDSRSGPSPGQTFSGLLQRLTCQGALGTEGAAQDPAVQELDSLIGAADWPALLQGDPGIPQALEQVARTLCGQAAPPKEEYARGALATPAAERAACIGAVLLGLLERMEAAKGLLGPSGVMAALRPAAPHIYIFSVTHCQEHTWTSPESQKVAQEVLALLLRVTDCVSVAEFLRGETEDQAGMFTAVMSLLKPELNKESWKNNPATKHIFSWTLHQVTRPWLSHHLERILPPSLLISDDYQTENKVLGVHCLHHIVLNVPAADLRQFNRSQVLYHALFNHLYTPEPDLIQAVLECLLDLFPVLERPLHWKAPERRPTGPCDDVLQLILTHMEPEYRLLLRRTYARNLPAFVQRLGILTVRHLKRLEQVIIGYLEVYDGPEEEARLRILETLKLTIQHCWPRIPCRLEIFLKTLLKMVCDVVRDQSLTPEPVKAALLKEANCLTLLDHCSSGQVTSLLAKAVQSCKDDKVLDCIRKVQQLSGIPTEAGM
ncbi:TELO2-interacting protein 2 [Phascolarctos cinereus]|uniref:TELO2-interacting protein 2 n=1 Tax=Phascolarctos cinereus TaxID=38626 RepID=A0A6P5K8K7_PHACI|nr:TELO2-interacting protein 2 [Phascolarctos cinereus]